MDQYARFKFELSHRLGSSPINALSYSFTKALTRGRQKNPNVTPYLLLSCRIFRYYPEIRSNIHFSNQNSCKKFLTPRISWQQKYYFWRPIFIIQHTLVNNDSNHANFSKKNLKLEIIVTRNSESHKIYSIITWRWLARLCQTHHFYPEKVKNLFNKYSTLIG